MNLESQLQYMLEIFNERLDEAVFEGDLEKVKYLKQRIQEIEYSLWGKYDK